MTKEEIEHICATIYEIGHAHGSNAFRMFRKQEPLMVDQGWYPLFQKLLTSLAEMEERVKELESENIIYRNACQDWEIQCKELRKEISRLRKEEI